MWATGLPPVVAAVRQAVWEVPPGLELLVEAGNVYVGSERSGICINFADTDYMSLELFKLFYPPRRRNL